MKNLPPFRLENFPQDCHFADMRWGFCAVLIGTSLLMCLNASAAVIIWNGEAKVDNWSGGGNNGSNNWVGKTTPVAGDSIIFSSTTRLTPNNNTPTGTSYSGITFSTAAGAFTLNGNAITLDGSIINQSTNLQTINMALILNATQTLNAANGAILISKVISGVGGINKTGSATLTVSSDNTYTGATTVSAGTLKAGVASVANVSGAFGNNSQVTLANAPGVVLDITGYDTQIGSLTGGGTNGGNVTLGAARLTVGGANTSPLAYVGIISGNGGVTKIGTGTQIFSGANTYTGTTIISGGSLYLNNSSGSATGTGSVTVQNGATLGGSGTAAGETIIDGNLNPGNHLGVISFGGALRLQTTATTTIEIVGATRGTQYDGINVGSALTYGGALVMDFRSVFGASTTFNLFDFVSQSSSFETVSLTGEYSGSMAKNDAGVWNLTSGSHSWIFTQSTGDLNFANSGVIPEPRAALLGGLGVLLLFRRRR